MARQEEVDYPLHRHEHPEFPYIGNQDDNINGGIIYDKDDKAVGFFYMMARFNEDETIKVGKFGAHKFEVYVTLPDRRIVGQLSQEKDILGSGKDLKKWFNARDDLVRLNFGEGAYISHGIPITRGRSLYPPFHSHEELQPCLTWQDYIENPPTLFLEYEPIEEMPDSAYIDKDWQYMEDDKDWESFYRDDDPE